MTISATVDPIQLAYDTCSQKMGDLQAMIESKMRKIAAASQAKLHETLFEPKRRFEKAAKAIWSMRTWMPFLIKAWISKKLLSDACKVVLRTCLASPYIKIIEILEYQYLLVKSGKKTSHDRVLEKNHQKLAAYEKDFKMWEIKRDDYRKKLGIPLPYFEEMRKAIEEGEDEDNRWYFETTCCTRPSKYYPVGQAKDIESRVRDIRAKKIFKIAMKNKDVRELYIEAMMQPDFETQKTGSWQFMLYPSERDSRLEFGAFCSTSERLICINDTDTDNEILKSLVFELTNAASCRRMDELNELALKGQMPREDFAKKIEEIEHEGSIRFHFIIHRAIKKHGWSYNLAEPLNFWLDFDREWDQTKTSIHTERYREYWDLLQEDRLKQEMLISSPAEIKKSSKY